MISSENNNKPLENITGLLFYGAIKNAATQILYRLVFDDDDVFVDAIGCAVAIT
jgi:hypothetical protein